MRTAIIAGAGSGIGKALLIQLSINSRAIGLSRRGEEDKSELVSGKNYKCDLRNESEIKNIFDKVQSIDSIYITLGDGLFKPFHELTLTEWNDHLELNLTAPFLILKSAYPYLKKSINPLVVLISSTAGKVGFPDSSAYCTTKHGIAGLAKSLREEWKPDIRVVTVYPGAIYTPIWEGREGFNKNDMITEKDFAIQLSTLESSPLSLNIEEMYILPRKGIL